MLCSQYLYWLGFAVEVEMKQVRALYVLSVKAAHENGAMIFLVDALLTTIFRIWLAML